MPFKVKNEVKIIIFQYNVIHNVLPTRVTLYPDGISESPICNLCNTEEQTLHLHTNSRFLDRFCFKTGGTRKQMKQ